MIKFNSQPSQICSIYAISFVKSNSSEKEILRIFFGIVANTNRRNNLPFRNTYHETRHLTSVPKGFLRRKQRRYILRISYLDMAELFHLRDCRLPWLILLQSSPEELETMDQWPVPRPQRKVSSWRFPEQRLRYFDPSYASTCHLDASNVFFNEDCGLCNISHRWFVCLSLEPLLIFICNIFI